MKVKVSITSGGATAEDLDDLHADSSADDVSDHVRRLAAALRAALGDDKPSAPAPAPSPATTSPATATPSTEADDPDAPQNGRQLLAWAGDRGLKPRVYKLKDAWHLPDVIVQWGRNEALAVYRELVREAPPYASSRASGRNGYARPRA